MKIDELVKIVKNIDEKYPKHLVECNMPNGCAICAVAVNIVSGKGPHEWVTESRSSYMSIIDALEEHGGVYNNGAWQFSAHQLLKKVKNGLLNPIRIDLY